MERNATAYREVIDTKKSNPSGISLAYENPKQKKGSDAFCVEYAEHTSDAAIRDDIISYLGEYRFQLPKYEYEFGIDKNGYICEIKDGERMLVKNKRAIEKRSEEGKSTSREEAELRGMHSLENQLNKAPLGSTVLWGSPPGPKEDGYGEYGFVFVGKLKEESGEKKLKMNAIRVENPTLTQYDNVMKLFTSLPEEKNTAEDFLASPVVLPEDIEVSFVEKTISHIFSPNSDLKRANNTRMLDFTSSAFAKSSMSGIVSSEKKGVSYDQFRHIIGRMDGLINEVISVFRKGSNREKLEAFYTLENVALALKHEYEREGVNPKEFQVFTHDFPLILLEQMKGRFGFEPPAALGSCGSTSQKKSNNPFSFGFEALNELLDSTMKEDKYGSLEVECPSCHKKNMREKDTLLSSCRHCGSEKISC